MESPPTQVKIPALNLEESNSPLTPRSIARSLSKSAPEKESKKLHRKALEINISHNVSENLDDPPSYPAAQFIT